MNTQYILRLISINTNTWEATREHASDEFAVDYWRNRLNQPEEAMLLMRYPRAILINTQTQTIIAEFRARIVVELQPLD